MTATSLFLDDRPAPAAPAEPPAAPAAARRHPLRRVRPELALLLLIAGVLNLWGLSENGWANEYYSAAVRSMSSSWHAFLYGSFDASGAMTVDKPPLASWVQVGVREGGRLPLAEPARAAGADGRRDGRARL